MSRSPGTQQYPIVIHKLKRQPGCDITGYMRTEYCPKCDSLTFPKYDSKTDQLKYSCSCGYEWFSEPKTKDSPEERTVKEEATKALYRGMVQSSLEAKVLH